MRERVEFHMSGKTLKGRHLGMVETCASSVQDSGHCKTLGKQWCLAVRFPNVSVGGS